MPSCGNTAVPALIENLSQGLEGDPTTAVGVLEALGDARATPALLAELARGRVRRDLVVQALGVVGDPRGLVPVLALLEDPEPALRKKAMTALRPMLDGRAADALVKALDDEDPEVQALAVGYLGFGVAPAAVLYLWTMGQLNSIGWAIVLFFAVCCALRLARFNTQLAAEPPPWTANFFSGVPAPAGAGLLMLPMFVSFEWEFWLARSPYVNAVWISLVALLMVSTIPTVSLKRIRIPSQYVMPTLLGIGVLTLGDYHLLGASIVAWLGIAIVSVIAVLGPNPGRSA